MTKQSLAIHVLSWASRQDNPTANINARVLLALCLNDGKKPSIGDLFNFIGSTKKQTSDSLQQLRRAGYLKRDHSLGVSGMEQVRKILNIQQ